MSSRGLTRVVLVEPVEANREALARMLGEAGTVWVTEACATYEAGAAALLRAPIDLLVVGLDADAAAGLDLVQAAQRARPDLAVLPASSTRDADQILRALRAGAREFLALPTRVEELAEVLARLVKPRDGAGPGADSRVVAILGATGGVGCTTLAVNLGVALAKPADREVVLLDFDLHCGAVDACLDLVRDQTIADVAQAVERLDVTLLKRALTRHGSGLFVLPAPAVLQDALALDPESLRQVLQKLGAVFPLALVDLGKGLQPSDQVALELADEVLVVLTLEPICLRNTARLLDLFRSVDGAIDRVKLVANQVGSSAFEVGLKKAESLLKRPIAWQVPYDARVFAAARAKGVPMALDAPGCRAQRAVQEIARSFGTPEREASRTRFQRIAASLF